MINKRTVFILGAGASQPFGYPTGCELKKLIITEYNTNTKIGSDRYGELNKLGIKSTHIDDFISAFSNSGKATIDSFLEGRPEFLELGKLVIAQMLIPYENHDSLFGLNDGNWYGLIYNILSDDIARFEYNKLAFITFNYDRSLDYYLFNSLKHSFDLNDDACVYAMSSIPLIHVHGKLGNLPWQGDNARPYCSKYKDVQELKLAANNIKIISEDKNSSSDFEYASEFILPGSLVYFLGFGFHNDNVERLGNGIFETHAIPIATSVGLEEADRRRIDRMFRNPGKGIGFDIFDHPNDQVILKFIKKNLEFD